MNLEEMNRVKAERGLSFKQLSAYTGVPAVTLQKVFSGNTKNPRKATLDAIERVLSGDEQIFSGKALTYEQAGKASEPPIVAERSSYRSSSGSYDSSSNTPCVAEANAYHAASVLSAKKQGEYTVEDYQNTPEDQRIELIDGVIYDLASPKVVHQDWAFLIHDAIYHFIRKNKGKCRVFEAPVDVRLDKDNRTMVVPDVIVVCDRDKVKEGEIYGAPDFILEVLSPSTRKKDMTIKLGKYAEAGVREYWILDPDRRKLITYNFMEEDWIPQIRNLEGKAAPAIFDGQCEIDLDELAESIREFGDSLR